MSYNSGSKHLWQSWLVTRSLCCLPWTSRLSPTSCSLGRPHWRSWQQWQHTRYSQVTTHYYFIMWHFLSHAPLSLFHSALSSDGGSLALHQVSGGRGEERADGAASAQRQRRHAQATGTTVLQGERHRVLRQHWVGAGPPWRGGKWVKLSIFLQNIHLLFSLIPSSLSL